MYYRAVGQKCQLFNNVSCNVQQELVRTTRQKITSCWRLLKTGLNNVVLPTLFNVVNNIVQHRYTRLQAGFRLINLFNIVDNIEQCEQHNIVHAILFSTTFILVKDRLSHYLSLGFREKKIWKTNTGTTPHTYLKHCLSLIRKQTRKKL